MNIERVDIEFLVTLNDVGDCAAIEPECFTAFGELQTVNSDHDTR